MTWLTNGDNLRVAWSVDLLRLVCEELSDRWILSANPSDWQRSDELRTALGEPRRAEGD